MRLECVATEAQLTAVVSVLRAHASRAGALAGRVAVMQLEELHPPSEEDISHDDPRLDTAVNQPVDLASGVGARARVQS